MLRRKVTFEDPNRFECLKANCAEECGSSGEDPTANDDDANCYPEPTSSATKAKKKRMKRILRKSQRQVHKEARDALRQTRDEQSAGKESKNAIDERSIPEDKDVDIPEVPIPDPSFQRPSTSSKALGENTRAKTHAVKLYQ